MSTEPDPVPAPEVTATSVRITSVDIPMGEVFTLVLRFTVAGVIVGAVIAVTAWAIIVGLRGS